MVEHLPERKIERPKVAQIRGTNLVQGKLDQALIHLKHFKSQLERDPENPILAKRIASTEANIAQFKLEIKLGLWEDADMEAPPGWKMVEEIMKETNRGKGKINEYFNRYAHTHPKWFRCFRKNNLRGRRYYSPEFVEVLKRLPRAGKKESDGAETVAS